jgi:hypothetical protein
VNGLWKWIGLSINSENNLINLIKILYLRN